MLRDAQLIAFVPVTSLETARSFYEGTLGIEVVEESPFALVLNAGGTSLRLARIDAVTPQPFTIVGWRVSDILASIAALDDQGVAVIRFDGLQQDDTGVWTTPGGDRVAWFHDPDGNTLSITEFA